MNWPRLFLLFLTLCCRPLDAFAAIQSLDLATVDDHAPLTEQMLILQEPLESGWQRDEALRQAAWMPINPDNQASPRNRSTIWLQARLHNSSSATITRWLEVAPWRMEDVQLFVLDSNNQLIKHQHSGLDQPVATRKVATTRTVFPLVLAPQEQVHILLRIHSNSRPYIATSLWEPLSFAQQEYDGRVLHSVLLACVLTLVLVLLLQADWRFTLLAAWILVAYIFEAEKEGYLSYYFLGALSNFDVLVRASFGLASQVLFMMTSLLLLGLWHHRLWRGVRLLMTVCSLLLVLSWPWLADNMIRQTFSATLISILLVWPLTLISVRLKGDPLRQLLLLMFGLNWAYSLGFMLIYVFNLGYEGLFAVEATALNIGTILAIIGVFSIQARRQQRALQHQLLQTERQHRQRLEEAVAQRTSDLHQALQTANEANRAKTDLIARVSHDLRSPLTSISGYAQLLSSETGTQARRGRIILRSAKHMLHLINDLIEYAQSAASNRLFKAPVYTHDLLNTIAEEAQILASRNGNSFTLKIHNDLPIVLVIDSKRLRQILINLLDNAAKFTQDGLVELHIESHPAKQPNTIWLRIRVKDNGRGIEIDQQPHVLEPFFRTEHTYEGVGLGLPIVHEWVKHMNGDITLNSSVGSGTEVTLNLPIEVTTEASMSNAQLLEETNWLPPVDGAGKQVWVVEDSNDIRELLIEELSGQGFTVHSASNGNEFLEQLSLAPDTPPSLVLTDYLMAEGDGSAVLSAVREHWPGVPVVLLSATQKSMPSLEQQSGDFFDASLMKPVNLIELRSTLAQLLDLQPIPPAPPEPDEVACDTSPPPSEMLARLNMFLEMGALTDLQEWAQTLYELNPASRAFALHMLDLTENGKLDAILQLSQRNWDTPLIYPG